MTRNVNITFNPYGLSIDVPKGENVLRAAVGAGAHINASCGGSGTCGKCRIRVVKGRTEGADPDRNGWQLACRSTAMTDLVIEVSEESRLDTEVYSRRKTHSPLSRAVFEDLNDDWDLDPPVVKHHLHVSPPTMANNRSDVSRVLRSVKNHLDLDNIRLTNALSRKIPSVMRSKNWSVTASVYLPQQGKDGCDFYVSDLALAVMTNLEPGDTAGGAYGLAIDIGTTSLCMELLDLNTGETAAYSSCYNPQRKLGEDVISRIVYSQKNNGLQDLQKVVVKGINNLISEVVSAAGISREDICLGAVAANTTMAHLLLGIDPRYLRESPYVPATNFIAPFRACEIDIDLGEHAMVFVFPSIASYVGGDIVAGLMAAGVYLRSDLTLYIDVGTNGEVAVGNMDWIMTASCSAGPAFEGGGIEHGMIAVPGAIEDFDLNPRTLEPMLVTVGLEKPRGICGSGLISAVAQLFRAGILSPNGKMDKGKGGDRVREGRHGREYVLAFSNEAAGDEDIVLTEADVDNLIRAKAAMYAGCQTLLDNVHVTFEDLDRVIIAGAFGSYLDLENAITIGLLPDIPRHKFMYVGNGALAGSRLLNLSRKMLSQAERISKAMTNVELSENAAFMDNYMASMFLPHTEASRFPSVADS